MKWIIALVLCVPGLAQTGAELQRQAAEKQKASAEIQRQAAQAHAESGFLTAKPDNDAAPQDPPLNAPCEPLAESAIAGLVDSAASDHKIEARLLRAVMERESGFRPCAVSPRGARGLMQLMPATAAQFSVRDPLDPAQNVATGAKYLKQLLDRYNGDMTLALSAYNAGPAAVDQAGGMPDFAETRDYVKAILQKVKQTAPPSNPTPKPIEN
jgi:soluble lytic murein transglycosylase-like protein